jgi:hypothetical protein
VQPAVILCSALAGCTHPLTSSTTHTPQLRRFLRKAAHLFAPVPAIRDSALAELAIVLWQQVGLPRILIQAAAGCV